MLVIDVSRSGRFGTRGEDKRTAIEDAAAMLALAAAHSNVRVGAILVSDRVEAVIPPRGGARHAMSLIDQLLKAEAAGTSTDLRPGLETAGRLLGSRAMVAVISDFIAPDFKDALGGLAARHDVRAIRVTDPAEMAPLPDVGLLPVVDAETGETRMLDTSSKAVRSESASAIARREAMIENSFDAARLRPISISTEGDPLETLELAFHPKAKQPSKP
ncbi:MAG: VWA domain-containing protein [Elusimicrobiota bacterium]|nr:MAG: VWA domain-containing protein [Elusimicrobiota bacterium]